MNLTHLRYFAELAHTHHYTRAAQNLCITQPSLSHAIFKMEEELGVPLFEKNGKNTVLTVFGEQFLRSVENSLKTLDDGIDFLQRTAAAKGDPSRSCASSGCGFDSFSGAPFSQATS
mgnify:CR=1 FL=1